MADHVDTFSQHRVSKRRGKPTIADIVNGGIRTGQTPEAIFATIGALYPKTKMKDIQAVFAAKIARQKAEYAERQRKFEDCKALWAIVRPIMCEPGNKAMVLIGALKIAVERGDERAKAYLAQFESADMIAWECDFKAAVALDPYWEMSEDGRSAIRFPGAYHKTAEELVAAYRANKLSQADPTVSIEELVTDICIQVCEMCGVDADTVDTNDAARGRVIEICGRITAAHSRRKEIQEFFARQAVREEVLRQCRERGLTLIDDEESRDK